MKSSNILNPAASLRDSQRTVKKYPFYLSSDLCQQRWFFLNLKCQTIDYTLRISAVGHKDISQVLSVKAGTHPDLNQKLNRTVGVKVREEGGMGSDFNLSINGLAGKAIKFFIDGVPMKVMASATLNNIPVNLAERMEVYKGVVPRLLVQVKSFGIFLNRSLNS
ncbi:TonB-dependent receptor [Dyadobacter pollutisoli]|uniref:TonB-dependent receptor n=1 Tax=Dyadobacter pollutisoli TaxID=2910158 RepID=UPI00286DAB8D|nr:TonB-dependent receptor plug domain-containing protein [Dyadobacter pollutisoli]